MFNNAADISDYIISNDRIITAQSCWSVIAKEYVIIEVTFPGIYLQGPSKL